MKVVVAGANGKVGQHLVELLGQSEHEVRAMVRDADQARQLEALGAEVVVADLEEDVSEAVRGCEAAIFVAGSGPHTGPDKTRAVDRDGAISMIDICEREGVKRFIQLSSMHADFPEQGTEAMRPYLEAKKAADDHLRASQLDYTIVRPGKLTQEKGTGDVEVAERLSEYGDIPRADVAAVLARSLMLENLVRTGFDVLAGNTPIDKALVALEH